MAANDIYPGWTLAAARLAGSVLVLTMYAGGAAAVLGWRPGIAVALAAALSMFLVHLIVGIAGYRRAMSRPWPQVRPVDDEDDW